METLKEKHLVEKKNLNSQVEAKVVHLENRIEEMDQSLRYAGKLQQAILPHEDIFRNVFTDAFVFYEPKDFVGGDFYWIYEFENDVYIAVGDCTGHGVPGALITIAGNTILRQTIRTKGVSNPAKIMKILDHELSSLFNDNLTSGVHQDGMDIVFCKFNLESMQAQFCSAGRPLVLVRSGNLIEFKKSSFAIGYEVFGRKKYFETTPIKLKKGDQFYLFSDGYTDQFGGDNVKKFNRKRFRNLLQSISELKMTKQKEEIIHSFRNWKGIQEQIDDVTLLGVRI